MLTSATGTASTFPPYIYDMKLLLIEDEKELAMSIQHYLTDKNKRSLTDFFKINAIPRYVMLSQNGEQILDFRIVSPLNKDQFEKSLNDSILLK